MATLPDNERPWRLCDPRRDRTAFPYTDAETERLVDEAVTALVSLRAPMWLEDPGPKLSVLVSLALEADGRLHDAAADAVDQGYSWAQVASRLDISASTARRRYSFYARWRKSEDGRLGRWSGR